MCMDADPKLSETAPSEKDRNAWWGTYSLGESQAGFWRIGPSSIWLYRSISEWRVVHEAGFDPLDGTIKISVPYLGKERPWLLDDETEDVRRDRFSFQKTGSHIKVRPQLADRAIVVRPETSLYISQGETVSLFVSTPLWFRIDVGEPARKLAELPLLRPSDTWFGPNTMEGELCYNTRTKARLKLDELPLRCHRAITPVQIRNKAEDALLLERLRLPVEHLSLFMDKGGYLWTERVHLDRERGDEHVGIHFGSGPPAEAADAKRTTPPREEARASLIMRPFAMLFHRTREA